MQFADPRGHATLRKNFSLICGSNLDPSSLARDLFSEGLITDAVRQQVGAIACGRDKLEKILDGVMANGAPGVFQKFVEIVKRDQAHQWLAVKLEGGVEPVPNSSPGTVYPVQAIPDVLNGRDFLDVHQHTLHMPPLLHSHCEPSLISPGVSQLEGSMFRYRCRSGPNDGLVNVNPVDTPVNPLETPPVNPLEIASGAEEKPKKWIIGADDVYKMDCNPHGICLIINNYNFSDPGHPVRNGTAVDQKNLVDTFKYLRYDVRIEENLSSREMRTKLREMCNDVDHSRYDSFVCCIMSHGMVDVVYGSDGEEVRIADLTGTMKECVSLVDKPKMFFLQACRGGEDGEGLPVQREVERDTVERDGPKHPSVGRYKTLVPKDADFFLSYAAPPGKAAYRSTKSGSWFISELCQVFTEFAKDHTLGSMMMKVNSRVCERTSRCLKQSIEVVSYLRKEIYFFNNQSSPVTSLSSIGGAFFF